MPPEPQVTGATDAALAGPVRPGKKKGKASALAAPSLSADMAPAARATRAEVTAAIEAAVHPVAAKRPDTRLAPSAAPGSADPTFPAPPATAAQPRSVASLATFAAALSGEPPYRRPAAPEPALPVAEMPHTPAPESVVATGTTRATEPPPSPPAPPDGAGSTLAEMSALLLDLYRDSVDVQAKLWAALTASPDLSRAWQAQAEIAARSARSAAERWSRLAFLATRLMSEGAGAFRPPGPRG